MKPRLYGTPDKEIFSSRWVDIVDIFTKLTLPNQVPYGAFGIFNPLAKLFDSKILLFHAGPFSTGVRLCR
jgi:hypothetical protein